MEIAISATKLWGKRPANTLSASARAANASTGTGMRLFTGCQVIFGAVAGTKAPHGYTIDAIATEALR